MVQARKNVKGKKAWRKVDTTDLEKVEHICDKPSADLFFTDKVGDDGLKKSLKFKRLRMDDILHPKDGIKGSTSRVSLKSNTVPVFEGGKTRMVSKSVMHQIDTLAKKKLAAGFTLGSAAARKVQEKLLKKQVKVKAKGGYDLWADEPVKRTKKIQSGDSLPKSIPAIALAHPGTSYRPTKRDHADAIQAAASVEYKKEEQKEKVLESLAFDPALANLEETFFENEDDEEEEEEVHEEEEVTADSKIKRKTKVQRNKEKRSKVVQLLEEREREQKKILKQINSLKQIQKAVNSESKAHEALLEQRNLKKIEEVAVTTKKLSRHAFKPAPMAIQLKEEMSESLLSLKPEGNLFMDRFASLQQRNMIETRMPNKRKRRYKLVETESHDYKRFK